VGDHFTLILVGAYKISGGEVWGVILTDPVGLTSLVLTLRFVVKGIFSTSADFLLIMFNTRIKCSIAAAAVIATIFGVGASYYGWGRSKLLWLGDLE